MNLLSFSVSLIKVDCKNFFFFLSWRFVCQFCKPTKTEKANRKKLLLLFNVVEIWIWRGWWTERERDRKKNLYLTAYKPLVLNFFFFFLLTHTHNIDGKKKRTRQYNEILIIGIRGSINILSTNYVQIGVKDNKTH